MLGVPPAFRFRKDVSIENAVKDLNSVQLKVDGLEEGLETSVSCSALGLSWVKYMPSVIEGVYYSKITAGINLMRSGEFKVFIVSTEDPQYSVFFIPGENRKDLFSFAKNILRGISSEGEASEIWIPSFSIESEEKVSGIIGKNIENNKKIGNCVESFRFKINSALHNRGAYLMIPESNEIIINEEFIFGMIHHKVDEELEVPLFVIYVSCDKFLKL